MCIVKFIFLSIVNIYYPFFNRWNSDPSPTSTSNTREKSNTVDDPFVVLESTPTPVSSSQSFFADPLEQFNNIGKSKSTKSGVTSPSGDVFSDMDPLNTFNKSPPASSKETQTHNRKKGPSQTHSEEGSSVGSARSSVSREPFDEYSFGFSESQPQKMPFDHFQESHQTSHTGTSSNVYTSPKSEEHVPREDDIWLTVSEIPLFTQITQGPPPSRPPPPIPARASTTRAFDNDFSSSSFSTKYANPPRSKEPVHDEEITHDGLERERAEEEREKIKEIEREKARQAVEKANREARERAANEARLKAERAAVQRVQTEARERAAVEARERAERAAAERAAAERAAAEKAAADKAAAEAKEKETREKEKAAVAKAQAEARRRAERAAVERVTAEARERAAAEARERAAAAATTAAKVNQQRNEDDLDSFFSMGSQPNTVPKARTSSNVSNFNRFTYKCINLGFFYYLYFLYFNGYLLYLISNVGLCNRSTIARQTRAPRGPPDF